MFNQNIKNEKWRYINKGNKKIWICEKDYPYLIEHGIDAIPFYHPEIDKWRMNQSGMKFHHEATNLIISGAVDDIWINSNNELIIVDYKATSTKKEVSIDERDSYKRQMEIYQWLFRKNGFKVSNASYFLYCNGDSTKNDFKEVLKFKISLLPYEGDDSWVENILFDIKKCLMSETLPESSENCDYCAYLNAVKNHVQQYKEKE